MPVHIFELTSEVTAMEGDMPLSENQLKVIVQRVLGRLEKEQRTARFLAAASSFKTASDGPAPLFKG